MPTYIFKCPDCGRQQEAFFHFHEPHEVNCIGCNAECIKVLGVGVAIQKGALAFEPHFNHSLGRYIRSYKEAEDHLKQKSQETGQALSLVTDRDEAKVTEEGMDVTNKVATDIAKTREAKKYL